VLREREKVRVAEEAISDEANAKEAAQLAKLAERREAVRWLAPLRSQHTQRTAPSHDPATFYATALRRAGAVMQTEVRRRVCLACLVRRCARRR
jgi:hypothetical protein